MTSIFAKYDGKDSSKIVLKSKNGNCAVLPLYIRSYYNIAALQVQYFFEEEIKKEGKGERDCGIICTVIGKIYHV